MNRRIRRNLLFACAVIFLALATTILAGIVHIIVVTVETIMAD